MTMVSDGLFQYGGAPVGGLFTTGKAFFVKPSSGLDGNDGLSPDFSKKTLSAAHTKLTADKNEVVYLISEDNSASGTTDYQSATLTWSKDGTHLIGINSYGFMGQRSRIAQLSTATGIQPLVNITASNCSFQNIHVFQGVNDATSLDALQVTGERNLFYNCHIGGIGHATMDVADNRTLKLVGAAETVFRKCVIGIDTITRATASSEIEFASQATRILFDECIFPTHAGAAGFTFLDFDAASTLDRFVIFRNCIFVNAVQSTASAMTELTDANASAGGMLVFHNCSIIGVTSGQIDAGSTGTCYNSAPTSDTNGDGGFGQPVD